MSIFFLYIALLFITHRFDENYALASTQNLKNKDIPEGGAKGTILPSYVLLLFLLFELNPKLFYI